MENRVFGSVEFNSGLETSINITYKGKEYGITVSADAYYEKDLITKDQEEAYSEFLEKKQFIIELVENKIDEIGGETIYTPTLLLLKRNGDYALIFDDLSDPEEGVAVTIKPDMKVLSVDQYL